MASSAGRTSAPQQAATLIASASARGTIKLRSLLRRGLRFKVRCSEACTVDARLIISARTRLKHRVVLVLAVAKLRLHSAGTLTGRLKVNRRLRSRLRQDRIRGLRLLVTLRGGEGQARSIAWRIRVIR